MKHHYTAKVYFDNDEMVENSGNDIDMLIEWMQSQAEAKYGDIKGEITDNKAHQIVKSIQFSPTD